MGMASTDRRRLMLSSFGPATLRDSSLHPTGEVEEGCGVLGAHKMKNGAPRNSVWRRKVCHRSVAPDGVMRDPGLKCADMLGSE
jgi:hypothetical protein